MKCNKINIKTKQKIDKSELSYDKILYNIINNEIIPELIKQNAYTRLYLYRSNIENQHLVQKENFYQNFIRRISENLNLLDFYCDFNELNNFENYNFLHSRLDNLEYTKFLVNYLKKNIPDYGNNLSVIKIDIMLCLSFICYSFDFLFRNIDLNVNKLDTQNFLTLIFGRMKFINSGNYTEFLKIMDSIISKKDESQISYYNYLDNFIDKENRKTLINNIYTKLTSNPGNNFESEVNLLSIDFSNIIIYYPLSLYNESENYSIVEYFFDGSSLEKVIDTKKNFYTLRKKKEGGVQVDNGSEIYAYTSDENKVINEQYINVEDENQNTTRRYSYKERSKRLYYINSKELENMERRKIVQKEINQNKYYLDISEDESKIQKNCDEIAEKTPGFFKQGINNLKKGLNLSSELKISIENSIEYFNEQFTNSISILEGKKKQDPNTINRKK